MLITESFFFTRLSSYLSANNHYFAAVNHRSSVNKAAVVFVGRVFNFTFLKRDILIAWFVVATFPGKRIDRQNAVPLKSFFIFKVQTFFNRMIKFIVFAQGFFLRIIGDNLTQGSLLIYLVYLTEPFRVKGIAQ